MFANIWTYIVDCACIYLLVSSNIGVFGRTLGLESEASKRMIQENKQVRMEIWRTLWDQIIYFILEYTVFTLQIRPHCDILKIHRVQGGEGGKENVTLQIVNIFIFKLCSLPFKQSRFTRVPAFRRHCENSSLNCPAVLAGEAPCFKTP